MQRGRTLKTIPELAERRLIGDTDHAALRTISERYAISVSPAMVGLIDVMDANDPIARQFVPDVRELSTTPDERADPIGDDTHSPRPGVVHRHRDRVLLKLTGICPVYCRFCFRREMIGPDAGRELSSDDLDGALEYVADHPEIFEVILTGGDPLMLSPRRIRDVTTRLAAIPHVRVLRWHSRVPVVAPERVTDEAVGALKSAAGKAVYVAVHANHPRELGEHQREALAKLADAGLVLISQTVLLKGVNDTVETLAELMRAFVANRVKPYYLHHPDLAPGTSHFRLSIEAGQGIVKALRQHVSGLAQPTYVLDIPGGVAKVPIGPAYSDVDQGRRIVRDPIDRGYFYEPAEEGNDRG